MSATNDGGPAFPNKDYLGNMIQGMTLRDWFAGQALAGIMCSPGRPDGDYANTCWAYEVADAMISAREKGGAE